MIKVHGVFSSIFIFYWSTISSFSVVVCLSGWETDHDKRRIRSFECNDQTLLFKLYP